MEPRSQYLELPASRTDLRPTYHFMMKCLLYSRMETGLLSNQDFYDEDVNVYIAHLLDSMIRPENLEQARRYLSPYDTDLFQRLAGSKDARLKYTIYKTNADFLLISLGVFDHKEPAMAKKRPGSGKERFFHPTEEASVGRGRTYYRFAYTYSQLVNGRSAGISEVLEKLSLGFDKYLRILAHMRGEYFDLIKRLSGGEVYHLERVANENSRFEDLKKKQDRFLDLYLEYKKTGSIDLKAEIEKLVQEIRSLDPDFQFEIPRS
ncbi:MAG: hypothetical protein GF346_11805 [Candidatus Eisenbacteria bacterium]|nr:hypothetical protein [Candidatus Latescibacterota bacterium]MBD3303121.1 hypothetical protein [Candidatus Eisenbacteria bacterium]